MARVEQHQFSVEWLLEAIRSADSLEGLQRLVGPSQEERDRAALRIRQMDSLYREMDRMDCDSSHCKGDHALACLILRQKLERVQAEQQAFEERYC